jgi:hypothetical protein
MIEGDTHVLELETVPRDRDAGIGGDPLGAPRLAVRAVEECDLFGTREECRRRDGALFGAGRGIPLEDGVAGVLLEAQAVETRRDPDRAPGRAFVRRDSVAPGALVVEVVDASLLDDGSAEAAPEEQIPVAEIPAIEDRAVVRPVRGLRER